jgi:hypothetical protein
MHYRHIIIHQRQQRPVNVGRSINQDSKVGFGDNGDSFNVPSQHTSSKGHDFHYSDVNDQHFGGF